MPTGMKGTQSERGTVEILPWLPGELAAEIDLSELAPPTAAIADVCAELGLVLDAHVAAYRATALGRPTGLCSVFQVAGLALPSVDRLIAAERRFPGIVFVAYRKPLLRRGETGARHG